MATLSSLIKSKKLFKFNALLEVDQLEQRGLYLTKEAMEWTLSSRELGYKSPNDAAYDIVSATLSGFVAGDLLREGSEIRRLGFAKKDKKLDVWEIKTPAPDPVRVFGWFYSPNVFVASHCEFKKNLPKVKSYEPHIEKVIELRKKLGIERSPNFKWNDDGKKYFNIS